MFRTVSNSFKGVIEDFLGYVFQIVSEFQRYYSRMTLLLLTDKIRINNLLFVVNRVYYLLD